MRWLEKMAEMLEEEQKPADPSPDIPDNVDPEKAGENAEKSLNKSETKETEVSGTNTDNKGENNNELQNKEE